MSPKIKLAVTSVWNHLLQERSTPDWHTWQKNGNAIHESPRGPRPCWHSFHMTVPE